MQGQKSLPGKLLLRREVAGVLSAAPLPWPGSGVAPGLWVASSKEARGHWAEHQNHFYQFRASRFLASHGSINSTKAPSGSGWH